MPFAVVIQVINVIYSHPELRFPPQKKQAFRLRNCQVFFTEGNESYENESKIKKRVAGD
jgi:hypothetical protein